MSSEPGNPFLLLKKIGKVFSTKGNRDVVALEDVSIHVKKGECFGIVGESGSGKSTLARIASGILKPDFGEIIYGGRNARAEQVHFPKNTLCGRVQMIFQNPLSSFSPRMKIGPSVCEPLKNLFSLDTGKAAETAKNLLETVGLDESYFNRLPHQVSGGELQRVSIARALAAKPEILVCDEATSSLDVSTQRRILSLLIDLQEKSGLSYLFVSHDLLLVQNISHRICVLYTGRVVEIARANSISDSAHPYTRKLFSSVLSPRRRSVCQNLPEYAGEATGNFINRDGCLFRPRCPKAAEICSNCRPELREISPGHVVACHFCD